MSKFVDSIKSESPASLYVFNQASPGNVTDQGFTGNDLVLTENGVTADAIPSLIPGERWSVHTPVAYDYDTGSTVQYHAAYKAGAYSIWEHFYNLGKDWTVEAVFRTGHSTSSLDDDGPVWGFYDPTDGGILLGCVETATGWDLSVVIALQSGRQNLITHQVSSGERVHAAVINTERNFTLMVNGDIVGVAQVAEDEALLANIYQDLHVAGQDAENHSNVSAMAALAAYEYALKPEDISARYELLQARRSFLDYMQGFGPSLLTEPTEQGMAVLAPELDDLFVGSDSDLELVASPEVVTIRDSSLSAGISAEKKNSYDLTAVEAIGPVYHDFTSTTGANSTVIAEYSFDDTTYSSLPTGADAIPEVNQVWAQAPEGTL